MSKKGCFVEVCALPSEELHCPDITWVQRQHELARGRGSAHLGIYGLLQWTAYRKTVSISKALLFQKGTDLISPNWGQRRLQLV